MSDLVWYISTMVADAPRIIVEVPRSGHCVIVTAGWAGCVLAAGLSENPVMTGRCLETGLADPRLEMRTRAAFSRWC
jgi:hypothetical protein